MSTRGLYTFKGETAADTWNVYRHSDNYPTGAAEVLADTVKFFAWQLPRYEADEFAAAFCAAGKSHYYLQALQVKTAKDRAVALRYTPLSKEEKPYNGVGGGIRFMPQGDPMQVALSNCSDIEYRYEIFQGNRKELRIRAYDVSAWDAPGKETLLTDCPLSEFAAWAEAEEKKQRAEWEAADKKAKAKA